jgi:hypothetical protein
MSKAQQPSHALIGLLEIAGQTPLAEVMSDDLTAERLMALCIQAAQALTAAAARIQELEMALERDDGSLGNARAEP